MSQSPINRALLRNLLSDVGNLVSRRCHTEARMRLAVTFGLFEVNMILTHISAIHAQEKRLPRSLGFYRETLTHRILDHIERLHGPEVRRKIQAVLYGPIED